MEDSSHSNHYLPKPIPPPTHPPPLLPRYFILFIWFDSTYLNVTFYHFSESEWKINININQFTLLSEEHHSSFSYFLTIQKVLIPCLPPIPVWPLLFYIYKFAQALLDWWWMLLVLFLEIVTCKPMKHAYRLETFPKVLGYGSVCKRAWPLEMNFVTNALGDAFRSQKFGPCTEHPHEILAVLYIVCIYIYGWICKRFWCLLLCK